MARNFRHNPSRLKRSSVNFSSGDERFSRVEKLVSLRFVLLESSLKSYKEDVFHLICYLLGLLMLMTYRDDEMDASLVTGADRKRRIEAKKTESIFSSRENRGETALLSYGDRFRLEPV